MSVHENPVGATVEWYTPASLFDALGVTFDLDPAGSFAAAVPARQIIARPEDGLAGPWHRDAHLPAVPVGRDRNVLPPRPPVVHAERRVHRAIVVRLDAVRVRGMGVAAPPPGAPRRHRRSTWRVGERRMSAESEVLAILRDEGWRGPMTIERLTQITPPGISRRDIESAIQQLRLEGQPIITDAHGVHLSHDPAEVRATAMKLRDRALTQMVTAKALDDTADRLEAGPMTLGLVA